MGSGEDLLEIRSIESVDTTYRIISKNVSEYQFIIPYTNLVEIGEIFTIDDPAKKMRFLARVVDIRHDSNYNGNWDTTMRGFQFFDQDQIFNRVVAEPLGCILDGAFHKQRTIPTKFSQVKRAVGTEFKFLSQVMGDIEVGYLRNGSQIVSDVPIALHSVSMDHHMGVFATTGMGKSNFMKVFAASCMRLAARGESKFGLLIVDPHGEYLIGSRNFKGVAQKGLLHLKKYGPNLACYSTDRENCNIPNVEEFSISIDEVRPDDVAVLYDWSAPQKDALETISDLFEGSNWLEELQTPEGVAKLASRGYMEGTIQVIARRIQNILNKNPYIKKRSSIKNIIAHLEEGNVVLLDVPRMTDRSEVFLLSVVSRCIMDEYKKASKTGRKGCLITVEEAQRVLGKDSNTSRFATIAREGRKFGVGLCAITQQPKLIDKELLSQFNTLVILGLGDRNDRTRLEESAKQDLHSLDVEIQTLEKGQALISTLNIPFPVPATIHMFEEYIKRIADDVDAETSLKPKGRFKPGIEGAGMEP